MPTLPGTVVVERFSLEVADVDVVEERLDLEPEPASLERYLRRLARLPNRE
jgi:hypothetical protein